MNSRDWIVEQLRKDKRVVTPIGINGLSVSRPGRPDAVAYCCERSTITIVTNDTVRRALHELSQTRMIVIFPSSQEIHPDTYEFVRDRRLAIGTLGGLNGALYECNDIGTYQHGEEKYVRNRLNNSRSVTRVLRKGHRAWVLERSGGLRSLTIITNEEYEVTDFDFIDTLNQYPHLDPDAVVATSPNLQGFSDRVSETARDAGITLVSMNNFVRMLHLPWT